MHSTVDMISKGMFQHFVASGYPIPIQWLYAQEHLQAISKEHFQAPGHLSPPQSGHMSPTSPSHLSPPPSPSSPPRNYTSSWSPANKRSNSFTIDAILGLQNHYPAITPHSLNSHLHHHNHHQVHVNEMENRLHAAGDRRLQRPSPYPSTGAVVEAVRNSLVNSDNNNNSSSSMNANSVSNNRVNSSSNSGGGGGGKAAKSKRIRTIFTADQLERLETQFTRQQYMVGPERVYLATTLQLTEAQVKVWFQNRRIKWRKQFIEQQHAKYKDMPSIPGQMDASCPSPSSADLPSSSPLSRSASSTPDHVDVLSTDTSDCVDLYKSQDEAAATGGAVAESSSSPVPAPHSRSPSPSSPADSSSEASSSPPPSSPSRESTAAASASASSSSSSSSNGGNSSTISSNIDSSVINNIKIAYSVASDGLQNYNIQSYDPSMVKSNISQYIHDNQLKNNYFRVHE